MIPGYFDDSNNPAAGLMKGKRKPNTKKPVPQK